MPNENCPVCEGLPEMLIQISESASGKSIECLRCGNFTIADEDFLRERLQRMEQDDRTKLSSWIRTKCRVGSKITPENFESVLQDAASYDYTVSEKRLLLLRLLESRTTHPGGWAKLHTKADYPVIWARDGAEVVFHLEELKRRKLISYKDGTKSGAIITNRGWDFLDENPVAKVSNQAFVAMSFSYWMKSVYSEGIKPALDRAGYSAYRADLHEHNERIDAQIEHEIRNSAFVVADVTKQNQGVYYEAGFARALGLPVIWSVKQNDLKRVHFDTRQYNHIVWKDVAELQEALYHRVSVLIRTPE